MNDCLVCYEGVTHQQQVSQAIVIYTEFVLLHQCQPRSLRHFNAEPTKSACLADQLQQRPLEVHMVLPCMIEMEIFLDVGGITADCS
jgi:hypothetical protein